MSGQSRMVSRRGPFRVPSGLAVHGARSNRLSLGTRLCPRVSRALGYARVPTKGIKPRRTQPAEAMMSSRCQVACRVPPQCFPQLALGSLPMLLGMCPTTSNVERRRGVPLIGVNAWNELGEAHNLWSDNSPPVLAFVLLRIWLGSLPSHHKWR